MHRCNFGHDFFFFPEFLLELLQSPVSILMIQSVTISSSWSGMNLLNWMPLFMTRYKLTRLLYYCFINHHLTIAMYSFSFLTCLLFSLVGLQMPSKQHCSQHARAEGILQQGTPLRHRPWAGQRGAGGCSRAVGPFPPEVPVWGEPAASLGH